MTLYSCIQGFYASWIQISIFRSICIDLYDCVHRLLCLGSNMTSTQISKKMSVSILVCIGSARMVAARHGANDAPSLRRQRQPRPSAAAHNVHPSPSGGRGGLGPLLGGMADLLPGWMRQRRVRGVSGVRNPLCVLCLDVHDSMLWFCTCYIQISEEKNVNLRLTWLPYMTHRTAIYDPASYDMYSHLWHILLLLVTCIFMTSLWSTMAIIWRIIQCCMITSRVSKREAT